MITDSIANLWHKNAVIYAIDVEVYQDSDGDGIGDFVGLTQRLNYLTGLGVTCLWLLPFYPSPNKDNGYDITDYYSVDPRFGNLGDFVDFVRKARELGIRVIIDLVVNHTSDEHPWFRMACEDKSSKYRDYYIWSKDLPENPGKTIVFPGEVESNWTKDERSGEYYRHVFHPFEPDLNTANPNVCAEIFKIMGFWLQLGVSGFRVDAAPFLIEKSEVLSANVQDPHSFFRDLKYFLSVRQGDAILLAEANVPPDNLVTYFGDGDEMSLLFNFVQNSYLMLALAEENVARITEGLRMLPPIPPMCQWANFLRTYDEMDLSRLPEPERGRVFEAFAPSEDMRIYGRGIRRRIPTILNGDRRRQELAYSLMFTLPGTPTLIYGEEIGMGDDLALEGRTSIRTPMQWSNAANGGFSTAAADALPRPVISGGEYGYERVNVADERRDPNSFINWMERVIRTYKEHHEFGWGGLRIFETSNPKVFAHSCEVDGRRVLIVHNLGEDECTVTFDPDIPDTLALREIFGDQRYDGPGGNPLQLKLAGYGYRWFSYIENNSESERPTTHEDAGTSSAAE